MQKKDIIDNLQEISLLLDLRGENSFKVQAHTKAARSLEGDVRTIAEIIESGELLKIRGIGKGIAPKIEEMYQTGRSQLLERLKSEIPSGLVEMLKIPGLGVKKIKFLRDELQIESCRQLKEACQKGKIASLPGFGQKSEEKILKGLDSLDKYSGLFLYSQVREVAENLLLELKKHPSLVQIEVAGSLRRKKEVTKDLDLVAVSSDSDALMAHFVSLDSVSDIINHGSTKSSVRLSGGIQADIRVVEEGQYPFALMHFTGSKEHNTFMRGEAKQHDWKLNEYGLFEGEKLIACSSEEEIYQKLGLNYIEPELREGLGEIEACRAKELPEVLSLNDIQGVLHLHTTYSDGSAGLKEMAQAAMAMGMTYLGVTDHSQSLNVAGGLKVKDVLRQHEEIDRLNEELKPFRIFKGIESDILADGSLDYEDEILAQFDFLIASIHGRFEMSEEEMTSRVITAVENPFTTMLGHPTGRLLLRREPYKIDMPKVIEAAAREGVVIEINAHPTRLDLDWRWGKYARECGLITSINPDAHTPEGLELIKYGLGIARKGWFEKKRVLNTLSVEEISAFFSERKKRALERKS